MVTVSNLVYVKRPTDNGTGTVSRQILRSDDSIAKQVLLYYMPRMNRINKEQVEKRSVDTNVNCKFRVQLEGDGSDSIRQELDRDKTQITHVTMQQHLITLDDLHETVEECSPAVCQSWCHLAGLDPQASQPELDLAVVAAHVHTAPACLPTASFLSREFLPNTTTPTYCTSLLTDSLVLVKRIPSQCIFTHTVTVTCFEMSCLLMIYENV